MAASTSRKTRRAAAKAARSGNGGPRRGGLLAKGDRALQQGDLTAAERSYQSAHQAAPGRPEPLQGLGRVHRRAGRLPEALSAYEDALQRAPEDAGILFELGNLARDMDMAEAAAKFFQTVIALKPDAVEAYSNLATVLRQTGRLDDAVAILKPAIERWPEQADLWMTLGTVMADSQDHGNAEQFLTEALRLRPAFGEAEGNLADLLSAQGRHAEALPRYRRALKLLPGHADAHYNYAQALLATGDLERGWAEYEWRLDPAFHKHVERDHGLPRWLGGDISDKRILVLAEQGVGDELRAAHCLPDLIAAAGDCLVECDKRLLPLLARSFPAAEFHPWQGSTEAGRRRRQYHWLAERPPVDLAIEAGSLPGRFRRGLDDFPPRRRLLRPDPELTEAWRDRVAELGPGAKVGIAWTSGLVDHLRARGYTALGDWGPILTRPGAHFVNLQYGEVEAEIAAAEAAFGITIARWSELDLKDDFDAVAALIASLDLVIAPTSAVRQLAAGLDVATWVMAAAPPVTALGRGTSPYAPGMRYFIRAADSDMSAVIARIGAELGCLTA